MNHQLILQVPSTVFEPLARSARQVGKSPEEMAVEWLSSASREVNDDPIDGIIGCIASEVPDWADQHDQYLGRALADELAPSKPPATSNDQ
jgi:hypothetical protein